MWRKVGRTWRKLQPQHWGPSLWAICEQLTAPAQLNSASFSGEKNRRKKLISQRSMKQVRAVQGRYSGPASQHSCIDLRTYNNCTTTRNQCQTTAMVLEHGQDLYFIGLPQRFTEKPELANCWWQTFNWLYSRQSSLLTPRFATPPAAVAARAGQR